MTKFARLHDGRELPFPDDLPDEEMHARVREHLAGETARAEDVGLAGQRNRLLMALVQNVQQLNAGIEKLCADQYATQALLKALVQSMAALGQVVENSSSELAAAIKAPSVQEVERSDDGKIRRTVISKVDGGA